MNIVMLQFLPLLAIIAIFAVSQQTVAAAGISDPCDPENHDILDEPCRSTGYQLPPNGQMPLCDISLEMGWYRFNSDAGGTMALTCPDMYQCGTIIPIWMNGALPLETDGIVSREACGNYNNNCCEFKTTIQVKRCVDFYVYLLHPVPSCPLAYCAGNKTLCPEGMWSPNMVDNCREAYPVLTANPRLTGPNIIGNTFNFQCEVVFPDVDPIQAFEIVWIFDGQEDLTIPVTILTDPDRKTTLEGHHLKGHLNKHIECKVRSYYFGNEVHKSPFLISNPYYCGIEVSPNQLIASERDFEHNISVTSTVPVVCEFGIGCCLDLKLDVDVHNAVYLWNRCTYYLCGKDWNDDTKSTTVEIQVMAKQDMVNGPDKQLLLTFEPVNQTFGGNYLQLFNGYRPDQVQITTKNANTATCHIYSDPNFSSFDRGFYRLYKVGVFTVAEVASMDFQVQIQTWPCGIIDVTCICGIAIREGNDVLRLYQCNQPYGGAFTAPKLERARDLGTGTTVKRSTNGMNFGVYLPSGSYIKVDAYNWGIKVLITLSGVYDGKVLGLCGTNDGIIGNEFTYPDNVKIDTYRHGVIIDGFAEAWQVNPLVSLFEQIPAEKPATDVTQYCECDKPTQTVDCGFRPSDDTKIACNNCREVPNWEIPLDPQWTLRRKREAVFEDVDEPDQSLPPDQEDVQPVDPNKQWPNSQGVTEAQATQMCEEALAKSQLSSKSGEMQDLYEGTLMSCLSDILFGETTQFLESITAAFTAQTQIALSKDPANYVTNMEGESVMKPEYLDDICDLSCDKHGQCGPGGVCLCEDGWEGDNCHIESGKGPQMAQIRSGPLCDKVQRPCMKIYTDVFNVDATESLTCRVQAVDEQGVDQGLPIDTNATSISAFRIACVIPETTTSSQHYKISASNDGSLFGNEKHLHVFDSTCMDCDEYSCTVKATACHINKVCYQDGTLKQDDPFKVCDISKDTTDWTDVPKPSTASNPDVSDICQENQLETGIHSHPYDCTKFIQCVGSITYVTQCQEGLAYDPSEQACTYDYLITSCQN